MKIRSTKLTDAEEIFNIQKNTWLDIYPNEEYKINRQNISKKFEDKDRIVSKIRLWLDSYNHDAHGWVAEVDHKIVGFARTYQEEGKAVVGAIYVLPKYQRQGIGKLLLQKALEFYQKPTIIWLEVAIYNQQAISFYQKAGFKQVKESDGKFKIGKGKFIPTIQMKIITD